jgi:hypothetical protein
MNDLLDVLAEDANQFSCAQEELKKIEEVKSSWRFSEIIECASRIISANPSPGRPQSPRFTSWTCK